LSLGLVLLAGLVAPVQVGAHGANPRAGALAKSPTLKEYDSKLAGKPMSLNEAVGVALNLNPSLAQALAGLAFAHGRVDETKAGFMPTVSVGPGGQYVTRLATEAYAVQATLPLDISHLIATATDQARFQEIGARIEVDRARNEAVYRVERAFYGALRAQALVDVAEEGLANSNERRRDAEARYRARAVAYIDVVRAQTDVADALRIEIQAKAAVTASLAVLAAEIGLDPASPMLITDTGAVALPPGVTLPGPLTIPTPDQVPTPPPPQRVPTAPSPLRGSTTAGSSDLGTEFAPSLTEALKARPEILEADAVLAAAEKGVTLARRSDLPSLAFGVGYFDLRTQSGSRVHEPQAFIGVNIPLYDGGLGRARVAEAKATVSSAVTTHRQAVDAVTLDVQQASVLLAQAREAVVASLQGADQARVAFNLAKVRYDTGVSARAGISPLLELSDAQAALTQAEENQVNALYDYNGARAQLDRAMGRFAYGLRKAQ